MPAVVQLREKLLSKLKELFQLDQPDLDFGFYRIMHAKSQQVTEFIERDLLKIVGDAFGDIEEQRRASAKAKYEAALETAKSFGAPDPEETEAVRDAKAKFEALEGTASAEAEIYDHLYRFFERYYDAGDFLSRRYTVRETPGKAAPYAIPYSGEEVKLHWANADQYYIKTAEHFTNFTFDLRQAEEVRAVGGELFGEISTEDMEPLRVHFKIVDATEGEHGNIKSVNDQVRYFLIHKNKPVGINDLGELVVNFEYRPDPEKTGQERTWRDKRNAEAAEVVLNVLENMADNDEAIKEYFQLLKLPAPTEKDKNRLLLAKYIRRYTSRNTMDYFIHKDLGAFLRRELDFYIKNEIMRLDDIENADAPAVETYLERIKVLRKIAIKLIDFLAQLEDFQKKLWLKKKFVVETNYCITLDRVPEELYSEIAANDAQHDEWIELFAIDEIEKDITNPGYEKPLTVEFLKANNKLLLDTWFFDKTFKAKLVAAIDGFDEQCDGLLVHSENLQALNLIQTRYLEEIKCIYLDPPFNTASSEIIYKNSYKHSSWLSMIFDRLLMGRVFLRSDGVLEIAIDDMEYYRLQGVANQIFSLGNHVANIAIMHNPKGREQAFVSDAHEYTLIYAKDIKLARLNSLVLSVDKIKNKYPKQDQNGRYRELPLRRSGTAPFREDRPYMYFPFIWDKGKNTVALVDRDGYEKIYDGKKFDDAFVDEIKQYYESLGMDLILPIREDGARGRWRWGYDKCLEECGNDVFFVSGREPTIYTKDYSNEFVTPKSVWFGERYDASTKGTNVLKDIIPDNNFDYPKSVFAVEDLLQLGVSAKETVLDYFAGSGTTAHAIINLNREDSGKRKFILVEMGDHFSSVMKPRIMKVVYSESWKDGKPTARHTGVSHCFKYIRLESYEDTLNNLRFADDPIRDKAIAAKDTLKEDYMLHYMLDVETRGSWSLLNIDAFTDPTKYKLKVKKPGSEEHDLRHVDLLETFNYLIGLRVDHIAIPQSFSARLKRIPDSELPQNDNTRLVLDGRIKQDAKGPWWFRKVEGWVPANPADPNNGQREKVLVIWRKLTGNLEEDNVVLDEWFRKNRFFTRDFEFDTIYVNGSNNLPNLAQAEDTWKVRLIEEEFFSRMWEGCANG